MLDGEDIVVVVQLSVLEDIPHAEESVGVLHRESTEP